MTVRIAAVQYLLRSIHDWSGFENQVRFVMKAAGDYKPQFAMLPEIFTTQLLSFMDTRDLKSAVRMMNDYTPRYIELFRELAAEWNMYVIGGSHPTLRDGEVYNTAYLFSPGGEVFEQDKIHRTRWEREKWNTAPGNQLRLFDTPFGKIAILVCYDIEFPELARILTLAGAEILFVPFSTDERKAYLRVRYTSQARAVENMVYVVLSGNVGNLPQVDNFLINYGEAIICTPSDFSFPPDAIAAKADFNTETVVISDLDLGTLEQVRELGSVRPLRDRRPDLYTISPKVPVKVIRTT